MCSTFGWNRNSLRLFQRGFVRRSPVLSYFLKHRSARTHEPLKARARFSLDSNGMIAKNCNDVLWGADVAAILL